MSDIIKDDIIAICQTLSKDGHGLMASMLNGWEYTILKDRQIVKRLERLRDDTSANSNSSTLWHGIDRILNGEEIE